MYSYDGKYREGVIFAFYDNKTNKILLEKRDKAGEDIFFTNGSVEIKDQKDGQDYLLNAMVREVMEEFDDKIIVKKHQLIGTLKVTEISIIFYIYLIEDWIGRFPKFTIEDGEEFAELMWCSLEEAQQIISYESGKEILKQIENKIAE